jgi:glycosyltransferase involved in cell wall biosynthesis
MSIYPIGFLGFMLNTVTRVPYFAAVRGNDFYEMREIWWKRWMIRRVLADTTIHVLSDDMKQDIQEYFPDLDPEFVIIGNGMSMSDERSDHDADTVLFVGRLAPKKGVEYLIEACASVAAEHELVIVGDGSERERLERLAADLEVPARFEGFVDPEDIDEYYRSSGIFVLPSTEGEGMPNAVLEAMSWGMPVVVTTSGALPEMIKDGQNGFIVPMRDSEAIAERLELMLEDLETRRTVGDGARAYIGETHSWEAITEQFKNLYQYVGSGL